MTLLLLSLLLKSDDLSKIITRQQLRGT